MINFSGKGKREGRNFVLADLPGYGYSKTSKATKASWDKMLGSYLEHRHLAKFFFFLISEEQ